MSPETLYNPQKFVIDGRVYVLDADFAALQNKYLEMLELLAEERIMLQLELHQVQKDRLELKKILRQEHGDIKRPLYKLPPSIVQELRTVFMEIHANEIDAKQRFDAAIRKPKPSERRYEDIASIPNEKKLTAGNYGY
jgi:hypothetical protein